jgi:hypothetical protein
MPFLAVAIVRMEDARHASAGWRTRNGSCSATSAASARAGVQHLVGRRRHRAATWCPSRRGCCGARASACACGRRARHPAAAETLGVKVTRLRYAGLAISGGFAGFGGGHLSIVMSSTTARARRSNGFIGMATTIFGNWRPTGVLGGASLFGFAEALKLVGRDSLPKLFLFFIVRAGCGSSCRWCSQKVVRPSTALAVIAGAAVRLVVTTRRCPSRSPRRPALRAHPDRAGHCQPAPAPTGACRPAVPQRREPLAPDSMPSASGRSALGRARPRSHLGGDGAAGHADPG